jgi:hypothetical protein
VPGSQFQQRATAPKAEGESACRRRLLGNDLAGKDERLVVRLAELTPPGAEQRDQLRGQIDGALLVVLRGREPAGGSRDHFPPAAIRAYHAARCSGSANMRRTRSRRSGRDLPFLPSDIRRQVSALFRALQGGASPLLAERRRREHVCAPSRGPSNPSPSAHNEGVPRFESGRPLPQELISVEIPNRV